MPIGGAAMLRLAQLALGLLPASGGAASVWRGTLNYGSYIVNEGMNITIDDDGTASVSYHFTQNSAKQHCVPVHDDLAVTMAGGNITLRPGTSGGYYSFEGTISGALMKGSMLSPGAGDSASARGAAAAAGRRASWEKVGSFTATKDGPPQPIECLRPTVPPPAAHLTLTGDPTEMVVSWGQLLPGTTPAPRNSGPPGWDPWGLGNRSDAVRGRVRYGTEAGALSHTATNSSLLMLSDTESMATYDYCGTVWVTHRLFSVLLTGLPADSQIFYTVDTISTDETRSAAGAVQSFRTPPLEPAATLRFLATADIGDPVSHSWTALPQMAEQCRTAAAAGHGAGLGPPFALGLHIGDIAYNLDITPRGDDYIRGGESRHRLPCGVWRNS